MMGEFQPADVNQAALEVKTACQAFNDAIVKAMGLGLKVEVTATPTDVPPHGQMVAFEPKVWKEV